MLEMIFVALSVVGMIACWYNLYQNKDTHIIVELYTNPKIWLACTAVTVIITATAVYFGWVVYAAFCAVSFPLDFAVKRVIFAR